MWAQTCRTLVRRHYGIEVGLHSYGSCLWPGHLPEGTRIGNYCSFADGVIALRRNHTIDRISQHPFFYNSSLGLVNRGFIPESSSNPLTIGHDVWIGLNVMIMPSCRTIGNSAVIAAGAVVTGDVPPLRRHWRGTGKTAPLEISPAGAGSTHCQRMVAQADMGVGRLF